MSETESADQRQACSACRSCERAGGALDLTISRLPQPAGRSGGHTGQSRIRQMMVF